MLNVFLKETLNTHKRMVQVKYDKEYWIKTGVPPSSVAAPRTVVSPPAPPSTGIHPPPPFGYKFSSSFSSSGEIYKAIDMWVVPASQDETFKKYGDIKYWTCPP